MTCKHPFFTSESSTASQAVTTVPSIPQYLLKSNHMLASNTSTQIQCFEIYLYFKYLVIFKHFNIMFCIYDVLFSSNMIKLKNPAIRNILKSLENTLIEKLTICNQNGFMEMI